MDYGNVFAAKIGENQLTYKAVKEDGIELYVHTQKRIGNSE